MATKHSRVNITLEPILLDEISMLALQQDKSISKLSRELIIEALERREDKALSKIADSRDIEGAEKVSHQDAWE